MSPRKRKRADERRTPRASSGRLDEKRGVFMISVAAELAEMHPQTLRMYEARGLISPQRSPKNTRLYSQENVERLRRIQRMTEEGLNLAGVESVLGLEQQLERAHKDLRRMRERADELERRMMEEVERVRKSFRAELVPYGAYEPEEIVPAQGSRQRAVKIPVKRPARSDGSRRSAT
jgi:MerR family transcriptional regulator/heat shock protein HspR